MSTRKEYSPRRFQLNPLVCKANRKFRKSGTSPHSHKRIITVRHQPGKMNQILRCDWLPGDYPPYSTRKISPKAINTEILYWPSVKSRWFHIGLVLYFFSSLWTATPSRSINTQKKDLGQYPAILTSHLVNNPYICFIDFRPLGSSLCWNGAETALEPTMSRVPVPSMTDRVLNI